MIVWYPRGELVVVKIGGGPAPWEILTPDMAREFAEMLTDEGWSANELLSYADAVDAMNKKR